MKQSINNMTMTELELLQDRLYEKENCTRLFVYTSKLLNAIYQRESNNMLDDIEEYIGSNYDECRGY